MVTLTFTFSHAVWLKFKMLITKVNVNIKRMRSRSNIHHGGKHDPAWASAFLLHQRLSCIPFHAEHSRSKTMASLKDVAKLANVSLMTVSRALNSPERIRPFPENWEMKQLLGPYSENPQRWNEYTVINQSPYNSKSGPLAIIIDCGYYDFFYTVNQKLHEKLRYYNIPHDFLTRPGGHTHEYWNNAIDYQLLFFYKYFHPN